MTTIFDIIRNHKEQKLPSIPTNIKLTFTENNIDIPNEQIFSFYQICKYPVDKNYNIRKIIYNEHGEMKSYKTGKIKLDKLKSFMTATQCFKYSVYPTYNFSNVKFPEPHVISILTSNILNN